MRGRVRWKNKGKGSGQMMAGADVLLAELPHSSPTLDLF